MAQMIKPPMRFTHAEWTMSNKTKYRNAELERQAAERLQNECDRLQCETTVRTQKTWADVDKKMDQRIDDVKHWKDELEKKHEDIDDECDKIKVYINRMEKAIEAGTQEPLHITQTCLLYREGRRGIDLVHDDVQRKLLKEVEVHHGVQSLLQKTLEQAKEQLRLNRKAKYNLAVDIGKKANAQEIDEYTLELGKNMEKVDYYEGGAVIDPNSVTPEEWTDSTNRNVLDAERQRHNSEMIRSVIDGILQQTSNDQNQQVEMTNRAFVRRIGETKDVKGKLEEHLSRVLNEMSNMEDNIKNMEVAIAEKQNPLKLVQTRIEVRKARVGLEHCRDAANYRQIEEVKEIKTDIGQLQNRFADSHHSLKALRRRQLDLEAEIEIKANTLFIDEVQCMGIRESIKINSY